jgi:hypothetical protein
MNKKLIVALVISALLAGGFLYFRDKKKSEEDIGRKVQAFNKLAEIGKKMPKAGLIKMGSVLKTYYSDHNQYPAELMDLYPDYVPVRKFIEELNWYYEPRGEDFFLSKTVERGSQKYAASIDQELIPRDGKTVLIASVGVNKKSGDDGESGVGTFDLSILKTAQLTIPEEEETKKKPEFIIRRPEIISVTKGEIGEDIPPETGTRFYVWRDKNGALGFGNVSFPDSKSLSIYDDTSWVDIKKPLPRERKKTSSGKDRVNQKKDSESMALAYGNDYLVWRYEDGRLGVGNIQYPDAESPLIYMDGKWTDLRPKNDVLKIARHKGEKEEKEKEPKDNIPEYSNKFLVWKFKDGRIGIGNVQYPSASDTAIYLDGKWVQTKPQKDAVQALSSGTVSEVGTKIVEGEEKKDKEDTISNLGDQYLVWKYKDGRIGMGNVQYPGADEIAHIWVNGTWQKVVKKGAIPDVR